MNEYSEDPLDALVIKAEEVEGEYRRLLAMLLSPHVRFDSERGTIYFIKHPPMLSTKQHVLVYLLARLALSQKNPQYDTVASSKDVEDGTGLPGGTVRPKLSELLKEKVISKGEAGYFVEAENLHRARALLEDTLET